MMDSKKKNEIPAVLIILGATGDLAAKKIYPAVYKLFRAKRLPQLLRIIGFSRRSLSDKEFIKHVMNTSLSKTKTLEKDRVSAKEFLHLFSYAQANFDNLSDFKRFAKVLGDIDESWNACSNKLFYLAVPPKYYKHIFNNLAKSGLTRSCSDEDGWTRVIVEKPFGNDLKTAQELDSMLGKLFREEQIFRIDHYLGKEMLQNILAFRFSNNLFEHSWSNKYIESIEIKLLEKGDAVGRGAFYDAVGALRDVGQNHLLQMLALTTMENPGSYDSSTIRKKREELLENLLAPSERKIKNESFRAQYVGYQGIGGIQKGSNRETYFKTVAYLDSPRWRGVGITLEAGKAMREQRKEIVIRFKHPILCVCPPISDHRSHNKIIFAIEPKEEITFKIWYKKPGLGLEMEKRSFDLPYREMGDRVQYTEEYERLLLDCFSGDQTLFITSKEMQFMWKYTDPIVSAWRNNEVQLHTYQKGEEYIRVQADEYVRLRDKEGSAKQIGIVGLGKMGSGIALKLAEKGWEVSAFNRSSDVTKKYEDQGIKGVYSIKELVASLEKPRVVWLMVPAGDPVDDMVGKLSKLLDKGDVVIDGGNTFFEDASKHAQVLDKKGIEFVDVGVSGGPSGARNGACLMVGGKREVFDQLTRVFVDLSVEEGFEYFEGIGAGHFVKMIHNGIEYGMIQAIAEGFDIMKNSEYKLHLKDIAQVYNHGSVIESRLVGWMSEALDMFGDKLDKVSGSAGSGGAAGLKKSEGVWTVEIAKKLGIPVSVIEESVKARTRSAKKPSYQGKVINALRNRFGGHSVEK